MSRNPVVVCRGEIRVMTVLDLIDRWISLSLSLSLVREGIERERVKKTISRMPKRCYSIMAPVDDEYPSWHLFWWARSLSPQTTIYIYASASRCQRSILLRTLSPSPDARRFVIQPERSFLSCSMNKPSVHWSSDLSAAAQSREKKKKKKKKKMSSTSTTTRITLSASSF